MFDDFLQKKTMNPLFSFLLVMRSFFNFLSINTEFVSQQEVGRGGGQPQNIWDNEIFMVIFWDNFTAFL